jgi:hypothetical protein
LDPVILLWQRPFQLESRIQTLEQRCTNLEADRRPRQPGSPDEVSEDNEDDL